MDKTANQIRQISSNKKISGDILKSLKKLETKPSRNQLISIGITVNGSITPIAHYSEKELEEKITCENCTLEYTIYGAFGHCPDCGIHNSKQIIEANFDLVKKILDLASKADAAVKSKLIENSLEDCISAFDGYAREHCSEKYKRISFQNIDAARNKVFSDYGIDISDGLDQEKWRSITEQFQKRHLLAHKMGIIDEDYIKKTDGNPSLVGRKLSISENDVRELIKNLKIVASNLFHGLPRNQ